MNEDTLSRRIKAAMQPPPAPAGLTARTVQRGIAIRRGLMAEKALQLMGSAPPGRESALHTALAVVGRMAQRLLPPEGVTADAMALRLQESAQFRAAVQKPADALLEAVRSGALLRTLTAHNASRSEEEKKAAPLEKQAEGPLPGL